MQLKSSELNFAKLKELQGNDVCVKMFEVDNGAKVKTETKITTHNGVVSTKYLHVTIGHKNGKTEYYREQLNGGFKGGFI